MPMMEKSIFALHQYALLGLFAIASYGLGRLFTGWLDRTSHLSLFLELPLTLASGMGIAMIGLFVVGLLGQLHATSILVLLGVGIASAAFSLCGNRRAQGGHQGVRPGFLRVRMEQVLWAAIAAAATLYLLIKPLRPPEAFDELMYHLPYARFWSAQGGLTVHEWLRYPLFAYNMELLYAASMVFGNDVLPHLLHAFTAAATALLVYGFASRYMDWRVGLVAVAAVLVATRWFWQTAYVDLGVMFFWSAAFAALALRQETGDARFSYLAAFLAGIAVGVKYQALFYLPVFAGLALVVERRLGVIVKAAAIFLLAGGYWYLRNFLIAGDPVHPIGGPVFGYWLWDAEDLHGQYADLANIRDWPPWFLLAGAGVFALRRSSTPIQRGLFWSAAAAVVVWYFASGYPRYLMAVYPMLALLAAHFLVTALERSGVLSLVHSGLARLDSRLRLGLLLILLAGVTGISYEGLVKSWSRVLPSEEGRAAYLSQWFPGYALLRSVGETDFTGLYQLGFEGEIHYLGARVRGDWFGPGRYREVLALSEEAAALARHLDLLGADGLLINREYDIVKQHRWDPDFLQHFDLVGESEKAALYRRKRPAADLGGAPDGPAAKASARGAP